MLFDSVDDSTFMLFAVRSYDNPNCTSVDEFEDDLKRIKYIKRLFKKYKDSGELKERLILNHLIVLYNVFQAESMTKMLCFKLHDYIAILKSFLEYMSYWPKIVRGVSGRDIVSESVISDVFVASTLARV